jgi:hypothetical protein
MLQKELISIKKAPMFNEQRGLSHDYYKNLEGNHNRGGKSIICDV